MVKHDRMLLAPAETRNRIEIVVIKKQSGQRRASLRTINRTVD